mmetsp:Transcript_16820/g.27886  ORF Transcript_16820/g.27886 Transcript_16820/m.27886 type:complete len:287 (+) Transcript_16820:135-995(+)|eukprot:CAMPEP_0119317270 /NCGR_PEP_ID=MMETSP1333-20130426/42561_1 /TAXON_ID=418940 /ORGANISM="Scyphosphaera apsteinii, Strain RCC1455" /LENGTH=286 /DNA_ID=CAMNT_0007323157 /DNA_START=122 /DNA_END=982 /DNA_ORIENTATION=+
MSQETKARELIEKAEKKLNAWSFFTSNKYEDAAEMFTKAANLFKVSKNWNEAGAAFEQTARCHLKCSSAHEAATAYSDAANCYKKTDADRAIRFYKEAVEVHIDLGRFTTAAKLQKEIAELHEGQTDLEAAMKAFETAADYYRGEESTSAANQCLLKVAGFAAQTGDYKKAIEIYEQVAMSSLDNTLLKWSVKDYFLRAGICHLATGEIADAVQAIENYKKNDASFGGTREGRFLESIARSFEDLDAEAFVDHVREFDEISPLDAQKTSLLLEVKNKIKAKQDDIT